MAKNLYTKNEEIPIKNACSSIKIRYDLEMVRAYDLELVGASIIVSILVPVLLALNQHARGYLNHVCVFSDKHAPESGSKFKVFIG